MIKNVAKESVRVLASGRIACINCDDMLVNGEKYPIVADTTKIFIEAGLRYRDRIIWKKPLGYSSRSRRSGVLIQHPYPMYFYPDNLLESILIFQKGRFYYKSIDEEVRQLSKIDTKEYNDTRTNLNYWESNNSTKMWNITNVLPSSKIDKGMASFPDELPRRLIKLYSYVVETVLDPFLGSGTTIKVAHEQKRSGIGYEIDVSKLSVIKSKIGINEENERYFEIVVPGE